MGSDQIATLCHACESGSLRDEASTATSLRSFLHIALTNRDVTRLRDTIRVSVLHQSRLLSRVLELLRTDSDYEHPHDVFIAVYTRLLFQWNPGNGRIAALWIMDLGRNLFWAEQVALEILEVA